MFLVCNITYYLLNFLSLFLRFTMCGLCRISQIIQYAYPAFFVHLVVLIAFYNTARGDIVVVSNLLLFIRKFYPTFVIKLVIFYFSMMALQM